jgi:hypothetical protein
MLLLQSPIAGILLTPNIRHLTFNTDLLGDSEKSAVSSESVLLVRQNLCRCECHYGEKLGEKLC